MTALPNFGEVGKDIKTRLETLESKDDSHNSKIGSLETKTTNHDTQIKKLQNAETELRDSLSAFTLFNSENEI